jgi:hypothetical protein
MKFGEALELCRQGKLIHRPGWGRKDRFVYYQVGSLVAVKDLRCDAIRRWAKKEGFLDIEIAGHFDIQLMAGTVQCGWAASQEDMRADDWRVLE